MQRSPPASASIPCGAGTLVRDVTDADRANRSGSAPDLAMTIVLAAALLMSCSGPPGTVPDGPAPDVARVRSVRPPSPTMPTLVEAVPSGSERLLAEDFGISEIAEDDVRIGPWDPGFADPYHWEDLLAPFGFDAEFGPESHHLFASREFPLADGSTFVEDTELVVTRRGRCRSTHRRIVGIDTGIEGEVGERIEAVLRVATRPYAFWSHYGSPNYRAEPSDIDDLGDPGEDCTFREAPVTDGLTLDSVVPIECELPGRPLRCYALSRFTLSYYGRPVSFGSVFLFDATTGMHLDRAALYVGLDAEEGDRLIGLAVGTEIGFDRLPEGVDVGQAGDHLVPTAEGLAVVSLRTIGGPITGFRTSEDGDRVVISWRLFRRAVEHRAALPLAS